MIDVAAWTMTYVLLDNIDETDSEDDIWKKCGNDIVTQHKCDGDSALFYSMKYCRQILNKRHDLKTDPGFTKKELYRYHNNAESNIHRGPAKRKAGKVIPPSDPSKKITTPQHPSSSSNDIGSVADADVVAGGAATVVASKTAVPSVVTGAADPHQASLVSNSKKSRSPSRNASEVKTTDSDAVAAIVAKGGGAVLGDASDTQMNSTTPRKGVKGKEGQRKQGWIGTWHNEEQRDPSYHRSGMKLPPLRQSSPRAAKAHQSSPSNMTISSTLTTPPMRNSKQDINELDCTASGHGTVTTLAPPDVNNAASSSTDDSTSIGDESSSPISKDNSSSMLGEQYRTPHLNGLLFRPSCTSSCITKSTSFSPCNTGHVDVVEVALDDAGDFVLFPATTYHRGFYSHKKNHNTFFTAQFFCVYKSMDSVRPKRLSPNDHLYCKRNLGANMSSSVRGLFNDLRCYWDTYYCRGSHAPPKKYKLEDIDIARNRVVTRDQIMNGRKFLLEIVVELERLYPYLEVELVWFIRKSDDGHGFQDWHKDQVINDTAAYTIVLNTGSYECTECTDDDFSDSSIESSTKRQKLSSFTVEGSKREYTNLDDAPVDALVKLQLARYFYKQCKSLVSDLAPIMGYSVSPLQTALKLDDASRDVILKHSKDGGYDKDVFLDYIIKKTFPSLHGLTDLRLPHFLDTHWFNIHRRFISHHEFHRANIKLASVLVDFLDSANPRTSDSDDDDESTPDPGEGAMNKGDDDESTPDAGEGAMDKSDENEFYDARDLAEDDEAGDVSVESQHDKKETSPEMTVWKDNRRIYCDWGEVGLCVIPDNPHLDKCQDSLGRCYNHLHHLCQITYVNGCGLPESGSITKLCRAHCSQYCELMGTAKRKSPPENMTAAAITRGASEIDLAVGTRKSPPETMAAGAITMDAAVKDVAAVGTSANDTGRLPSLPPFVVPPQTHWFCPKCKIELRITTKRCGTCRTWQGGKRGGATTTKKKSKSTSKAVPDAQNNTPKNKPLTNQRQAAKKQKQTNASEEVAVDVIRTGTNVADVSPFGESPNGNLDDFSIDMTNSITTIDDSLLQALGEDEDNTRHQRIVQLQRDDDNDYGDGGTSDGDGMGFEDVDGFREEMLDATQDRFTNGEDDVEEGILDTEENATQFFGTADRRGKQLSTLYGAPPGWMPPGPEEGWVPKKADSNKGEVPFQEVDNPGGWSPYTFRPVFSSNKNKRRSEDDSLSDKEINDTSKSKKKKGSGGQYLHHAMPCGAIPVPQDGTTGKRMLGGWEFFYQGWQHSNPTEENCRKGSNRDIVFPEGREVRLDGEYLKKMGLTKKRMEECDALFFYQLLVPICHPAFSGIPDDGRMGYYDEVANCSNEYALGLKRRSGTYGHKFSPVNAEELVIWDGIVIRNMSDNIADCWLRDQSNTYDRDIDESMNFRRWLDIKSVMKQNVYHKEKTRTEPGYDPTQKYRLIWDVMTHNMNRMIEFGGLDCTGDETSWPNSSYADVHSTLKGKKTDRGGQHVLLLDARRRYIYAWTPRHRFFAKNKSFSATGQAEVVRLIDKMEPLLVGGHQEDGDTRRQIFNAKVHITMDNYFSGDNVMKYLGERGYKATMTCRRDRLPEGVPKSAFHYLKGIKVDNRTRVARFEQPIVAVKYVKQAEGSEMKDYTLTHVSFQSTGGTNISSVNALSENVLYVRERKKGRGEQQRKWGIEMCNARELYLKNYSAVDKIDQALINWRVTYRSWKWWHAPMRHGKAIAMSMAYQIYLQCAEGGVDADWKVTPVSGPLFKKKMSAQMVNYRARQHNYPGDEKMRGATQTAKKYRGTSDEGIAMVALDSGAKRAHYDKYVDMKMMPRDKTKRPRLCSGNITLLTEHIKSMKSKHKAKCKYCGQYTYMMCTLCGVHVCWREKKEPGKVATGGTNLSCVMKYHDDDYYGIGMEDRCTLFGVPERAYEMPKENEIRANMKYMKELRLKYEAARSKMN
jgi:hypothetical protein